MTSKEKNVLIVLAIILVSVWVTMIFACTELISNEDLLALIGGIILLILAVGVFLVPVIIFIVKHGANLNENGKKLLGVLAFVDMLGWGFLASRAGEYMEEKSALYIWVLLLVFAAILFVSPIVAFVVVKHKSKVKTKKIIDKKEAERQRIINEVNSWKSDNYKKSECEEGKSLSRAYNKRAKKMLKEYESNCEGELDEEERKKLLEKFKEEAKIEAYRYSSYLFVYDLLELDRDKRKTENKFFEEEKERVSQVYTNIPPNCPLSMKSALLKYLKEFKKWKEVIDKQNEKADKKCICWCYAYLSRNEKLKQQMGVPFGLKEDLPELHEITKEDEPYIPGVDWGSLKRFFNKVDELAGRTEDKEKTSPTKPQTSNDFYDDDDDDDVKPCGTLASYGEPDGSFSMEELDFYDMMDEMDGYE